MDVASNPEAVFRFDYKPERVVLHEFQQKPVDITGLFFLNIGGETATLNDAPNSGITLRGEGTTYAGKNARVYVQNAAGSAGYNPNEEHALLVGPLAYALRNDLNKTNNAPDATSQPFVLIEYSKDATNWQRSIDVYLVTATNREFPRFQQRMEAGRMIQPPAPLRSVLPDNCVRTDRDISAHLYVFRDRLRYFWAKQAGDSGQPLEVGMRFFYPMQLGFWIPQLSAGDQPAPLTEVPWLSALGQANPPASPQSWMAGQSW